MMKYGSLASVMFSVKLRSIDILMHVHERYLRVASAKPKLDFVYVVECRVTKERIAKKNSSKYVQSCKLYYSRE